MSESTRRQSGPGRSFRPPSVKVSGVSFDQQFVARHEGRVEQDNENMAEVSTEMVHGGVVSHKRPGRVTMYKPTPNGWQPRHNIPVTSISVNLLNGWRVQCPDCGKPERDGDAPCMGGNECAGREPLAARQCPVCGRKVFDNLKIEASLDQDDPNIIHDTAYENSSPASRTKTLLDTHLWNRHPAEARSLGVPPLAGSNEALVQAVQAAGAAT